MVASHSILEASAEGGLLKEPSKAKAAPDLLGLSQRPDLGAGCASGPQRGPGPKNASNLGTHLVLGVRMMGMQPPDGVLPGQGQLLLTGKTPPGQELRVVVASQGEPSLAKPM